MIPKFINEKFAKLIITIAKNPGKTVTEIAKKTDYMVGYIYRDVMIFERMGLVMTKRTGRIKRVYTTTAGLDLAGAMMDVMRILEKNNKR